jgi:hypothetical protein
MKGKIFFTVIFCAVFSLTILSCDDGTNPDNPNNPDNPTDPTENGIQVYSSEGLFTGSGPVLAFNGSNNTLSHDKVGQITKGKLSLTLPVSLPDDQLHGTGDMKVSTFVTTIGGKNLFLVKSSSGELVYIIYANKTGSAQEGSGQISLTQGWNMYRATVSGGGSPVMQDKIADNLKDVYDAGYVWVVTEQ